MAAIQPCAFCGSPARLAQFYSANNGGVAAGASWELSCAKCHLGAQGDSRDAAIQQWNDACAKVEAQRATAAIKDCCKNTANLETAHEGGALMVSRCRKCGCRHFRARALMAGA